MGDDRETGVWRGEDGRAWRLGDDAEVAWIEENTEGGLTIRSAIPPVFEAYATLELPGSGDQRAASSFEEGEREWDRHEAAVLAVLSQHSGPQPWWLGYIDSGSADLIFDGARQVRFYATDRCCEARPAFPARSAGQGPISCR